MPSGNTLAMRKCTTRELLLSIEYPILDTRAALPSGTIPRRRMFVDGKEYAALHSHETALPEAELPRI